MALQLGNYTNKNIVDKINEVESKVTTSGFLKDSDNATITGNYIFANNVELQGTPAKDTDAINKKYADDISTTLGTKVTDLGNELRPKVEKNIQDIQTNKTSIDDLKSKVSTLEGGVIVIGTIGNSSTDVEGQTTLLDTFVQATVSREKRKGDLVITNDNYNFYYNGTSWVKAGVRTVDFANTSSAGIVKLGNSEGQLEQVDPQGLVKVKGFAELKTQSDTTKNNLAANYYNKTDIDSKVNGLENSISDLKASFKSVTDPVFITSNDLSKGAFEYTINNDGTKLIEVLAVFVDNTGNGSLDRVIVDTIIKGGNTIIYSDKQSIKKIVYIEIKIK